MEPLGIAGALQTADDVAIRIKHAHWWNVDDGQPLLAARFP
jgi:hypothetical protein